jgi:hypothetical protein
MSARRYVEAPAGQPLPFGLVSAALVIPDTDPHLGMGVQYETLRCATAHLTADECVTGDAQTRPFAADDGRELVVADAFTVYALHTCRPVGGGMDQAEADATTRLDVGFGRAVEEGFEQVSLAAADDLTPTPGTPVHPVAGVAILEEYAAKMYGGLPVLHVTRGSGTLLTQMNAVERQGTRLETKQGVPVASGGGYGEYTGPVGPAPDDGDPDDRISLADVDGARWLWITGAVTVRRGPVQNFGSRLRKDPTTHAYLNEVGAFASQPVVVTAECLAAAVLVQAPTAFYPVVTP